MLLIRNIDDKKQIYIAKAAKKKADRAVQGLSEEEEEELVLDIPQPVQKKGKKKVEIDPELIEEARQKALYKKELSIYGVSILLSSIRDLTIFCTTENLDLGELLQGRR